MTLPSPKPEPYAVPAEYNAWIRVDMDALSANVKSLDTLLKTQSPSPKIIAVVKANAYGHGAVESAWIFARAGVETFAVTTLAEALELREAHIEQDILVFAPPLPAQADLFVSHNITATITQADQIDMLAAATVPAGQPARVHIKVDTGMGRFGVAASDALELAKQIDKASKDIVLAGIYTHFGQALQPNAKHTERQFRLFQTTVEGIAAAGIDPGLRHCANSAAILLDERYWLDAVRPGTLLYGQYPAGHLPKRLSLKDGWSMQARVLSVRSIPTETPLGYGAEYTTKRPSKIAVLAVGYADGFAVVPQSTFTGRRGLLAMGRAILGKSPTVTICGKSAPIVGRIAMQTCMIDVTDIVGAQPGDIATVPARRATASSRLPRVYIGAETENKQ